MSCFPATVEQNQISFHATVVTSRGVVGFSTRKKTNSVAKRSWSTSRSPSLTTLDAVVVVVAEVEGVEAEELHEEAASEVVSVVEVVQVESDVVAVLAASVEEASAIVAVVDATTIRHHRSTTKLTSPACRTDRALARYDDAPDALHSDVITIWFSLCFVHLASFVFRQSFRHKPTRCDPLPCSALL